MKILLIDDETFALKLLVHQLASIGYAEVTALQSAREALEQLRRSVGMTDLIFTDLQMPDLDGVEFVRHLAQMNYAGDLVLISGEDPRVLQTVGNLAREFQLRLLGVLSKPITLDQLQVILDLHARPGSRVAAPARHALDAAEIRRACLQGELVNFYEPKVEPATGKVSGVEALVRWNHPVHGLVYPDEFISLAETHGLIETLTRVVIIEALQQIGKWREAGLGLSVSVNISMASMNFLWFPDFVALEAARVGVPLSSLILEVTESRMMQDRLIPLDILTRLRLKHIGLSIDDFGTGHSSLAQLRDIPFDELKIDRGFVHRAATDVSRRAIFDASIAMGRKLGMKIVAEGVEDRADWNLVRQAGCDYAQGYFIGRAMPAAELVPWMSDWATRHQALAGDQP